MTKMRTVVAAPTRNLKRDRTLRQTCEHVVQEKCTNKWPMDDYETPPFKPPWPSKDEREAMRLESAHLHPEEPLGPLAARWTDRLEQWYAQLQQHFGFDPSDLAANVRNSADRWAKRLSYLLPDHKQKFDSVMESIRKGHKIPFSSLPEKHFRARNPPSLADDKVRAWAAIKEDIDHGAITPVDLPNEGIPECVCPVRTADKSNGKARFVHNSRKINACIDSEHSTCELESLMKIRNMYVPGGYAIGSDYASGYHCLYMLKEHTKYLAFALHVSELTPEAIQWLHKHHPNSYMHRRRAFVFKYVALAFGLSTACRAFNNLITALAGFWRTCPTGRSPTRASSYIDDVHGVHKQFDETMRMAIRMVYEAAALGLNLRIAKCSFFPRHSIKVLGTIVDLESFVFRVSGARSKKIAVAIKNLQEAVANNPERVPAKAVASFIGLIWSVATCCHRAASVMTRSITDTLTMGIRSAVKLRRMPLRRLLAKFWSGSVKWTKQADHQLKFWSTVDFSALKAPISADVLGKSAEAQFHRPGIVDERQVTMLFQDASEYASGGGIWPTTNNPRDRISMRYLYEFSRREAMQSSTFREITGILKCLMSMNPLINKRVLFACDNWSSVSAVKFGSRNWLIQSVSERIFAWCLRWNIVVWPVWLPRSHEVIQYADSLSRTTIPHDQRSPPQLWRYANELAIRLWHAPISFDQAASHMSRIRIDGRPLPFNAFCHQPGAQGVDMFHQLQSWRENVNFVYPPAPMLGRLVTFLPVTEARTILAFPAPLPQAWWSFATQPGARGVAFSGEAHGFAVIAFDFRRAHSQIGPTCPTDRRKLTKVTHTLYRSQHGTRHTSNNIPAVSQVRTQPA